MGLPSRAKRSGVRSWSCPARSPRWSLVPGKVVQRGGCAPGTGTTQPFSDGSARSVPGALCAEASRFAQRALDLLRQRRVDAPAAPADDFIACHDPASVEVEWLVVPVRDRAPEAAVAPVARTSRASSLARSALASKMFTINRLRIQALRQPRSGRAPAPLHAAATAECDGVRGMRRPPPSSPTAASRRGMT
jgi:hypothetical protein